MMDFGKYTGPVLAAWAISLLLLAGLIALTLVRNIAARRALEAEEARSRKAAAQGGRKHG